MLVFLLTVVLSSMTLPTTNAVSNCSVCQLENDFIESNGYNCVEFADKSIACTCPNQEYTINKPCRICDRPNICGDDPKTFCAETIPISLGVQTNEKHYFACFCSDMSFYVGEPCPSAPTTAVVPQ